MAEEIQEAVQIIRVGYDGIEIAMKVCGGTIEGMKKAIDFLIAVMDHEKTMGKTDMRRLLMKGGDLQVFQFPTEDRAKVEKMAKKYGLLYSVLPDISRSFFADSSYMLSFSVLCSCVCSRLISPSVSSWHKQDNTLMHQSPGHIQRRTPYNF